MNPRRILPCIGIGLPLDDGDSTHVHDCRWNHVTGAPGNRHIGKPKVFCEHEWEISAVKS
jgi:hypothetical protein